MKNNVTKILIGIALMFTAGASYSEPVEYTFSTNDPIFIDPLLTGLTSVSGSFIYENTAAPIGIGPDGTDYVALSALSGSADGNSFNDPVGRVVVGNDTFDPGPPNPGPSDFFFFTPGPILNGFSIAGMPLVDVFLFWIEGQNGIPDFLEDQSLPPVLPPTIAGTLELCFADAATGVLHCAFFLVTVVAGQPVNTTSFNFEGQLDIVQVDNGGAIYSGVPIGTAFFIEIDRVTANGFISDGTTVTPFGCCTESFPEVINDEILDDADDVALINSLAGTSFVVGDLVDVIEFGGQGLTPGGGIIEIVVVYILDPLAFDDDSSDNFPPNPDDVLITLFFIAEGDDQGVEIYAAVGVVDIPSPQLLLRRSTDSRWFAYAVNYNDTTITIEEKGFLSLTRNTAFQTVSRSDFNGDGKPDLLLRDVTGAENGRWVMALLSGNSILSEGFVDLTRNADWEFIATRDFDGDGKADLLLRNSVDGRWFMYLLDAQSVKGKGVVAMSTDAGDVFVGSADFNGDRRADILLRRADGSWLLYTIDGLNPPAAGVPAMTTNLAFAVLALDDFNGDNRADVLLRRTDGRWFLYLMNGAIIVDSGALAMSENTDFDLMSCADFNGDGSADALLRRGDGRWFLYTLNGLTIVSQGSLPMTRNTAFRIVSAEDFSGDSMADILMRRTDGRWVLYAIDGNGPSVLKQGIPDMTRNEDWVPQTIPPFVGIGTGFGDAILGRIDPASELDIYKFTWIAGDEVLVRLAGLTFTMDPTISVLRPDNSNLCSGTRTNSGIVEPDCSVDSPGISVDTSGIHTVIVSDNNGLDIGDYVLSLQRLNGPDQAVRISSGVTVADRIDPSGELDSYTFNATSGDVAIVRVTGFTFTMDPTFRVFRPDGTPLPGCNATQTNSGTIQQNCNIDVTGTYLILVTDDNGLDDGDYEVNLNIL